MSNSTIVPGRSLDLAWVRGLDPADRKKIRVDAGVSRGVLASDLGSSEFAIQSWESGSRNPTGRLGAMYGALLRSLADLAAGGVP